MSDEPIFNENPQDVILGTTTSKVRDFIVNNSRNAQFNTQQGLNVVTSGGSVLINSVGAITASGTITTPLAVVANQGTFTTNVTAASVVAAFKLFDIPHPQKEGMRLRHGCLEGPELAVYVRGKSDSHVITLPEYWVDLVDETTITVQLTSTSNNQFLHVSSVNVHNITVGGDVNAPFYYMAMAERKDVPKMDIEKNA